MEYMPVIPSPNREAQASAAITSGGADTATVSSQSGSTVAATDAVATTRSWQPPSVRTHGTRVEDEGSAGRAKSSAVAILRGQQRHAALARSRGIAAGLALNASPPRTSSPGACGVLLTQCSRRMCGSDTGLWSMLCCCVCWAPWLYVCTMRCVAAWATRAASTLGAGLGPMLVPPSSPPFVPTAAAAALRGKQLVRVCHGRVPGCCSLDAGDDSSYCFVFAAAAQSTGKVFSSPSSRRCVAHVPRLHVWLNAAV